MTAAPRYKLAEMRAPNLPRCLRCTYSIRGQTYSVWIVQPTYNVALGVPPTTETGPFHQACAEREATR